MPFWADWTLILSSQDTAQKPASSLDRFFKISERGSTIGREVRGGVVTFFAMAYILVVNAAILGVAAPKDISQSSIAAGTALVACVMTLLMGLVANFPLAVASGMGLNAVVAFTLANPEALGLSYQEAMGLIFWEGVAITILVLTGFREAVFKAVPAQLKTAISVGIGLFIAFVGLLNAGIIRPGGTPVQLGVNGSLLGWPALVFWSDCDCGALHSQSSRRDFDWNYRGDRVGFYCSGFDPFRLARG